MALRVLTAPDVVIGYCQRTGELVGRSFRTHITVVNMTSRKVTVSVSRELPADDASLKDILAGDHQEWGRKHGTYTITVVDGSKSFTATFTKPSMDAFIFLQDNQVEISAGCQFSVLQNNPVIPLYK
eukprot:TRINITY_DN4533_c0_g1_i2.p1 TRINITY_DN4533_c0_g1~~TRINITY_DN4533_c0_g1_i2.p1  ORF type:complete len:127 (-),score=14.10 TRINITY_DN4533_c0_g1_i2:24-404(-)